MLWEDILTESSQTGFQPTQTFQEHLQKAILATLSQKNAFHHIVFQGGTSLRLFYGNPRFSEDLDFVLHPPVTTFDLPEHITKLLPSLQPLFPFLDVITTRVQKHDDLLQRCVLLTKSEEAAQQIRLHIELVSVPSYHSTLKILAFPPLQPAVRVETPQELLADKLLALGSRPYLKGRDLWDIYFLTTEKQVQPDWELVWKKTQDYQLELPQIRTQLQQVIATLEQQGVRVLTNELQRFLAPATFTMYQEMFHEIITKVTSIVKTAEKEHP